MNKLTNAGAKLVRNEISILQRNSNRNIKPWWELRLEGQIMKLWQQAKLQRKVKYSGIQQKKRPIKTITDKTVHTTWRGKSKDIGERKKTQKVLVQGQTIQIKLDIPK